MNPRENKDWKRLVVLDSCRYDCFKEVNTVKGELTEIDTGCMDTMGWYNKYWNQKNDDTVLVHGIYFVDMYADNFHEAHKMWDYNNMLKLDEQIAFAERVLENIDSNKRVIIHFLQPHIPFNNPIGRELLERLGTSGRGMPTDHDKITKYGNDGNWEEIKNAYKEEIKYVLTMVMKSTINPDVITSDHGIRIGEDNIYRHGKHCPAVHKVPWLVVDKK